MISPELRDEFDRLQQLITTHVNDADWETASRYASDLCNKLDDFYGDYVCVHIAIAYHQYGFILMKLEYWVDACMTFKRALVLKTPLYESGKIDLASVGNTVYNYGMSSMNIHKYKQAINAFTLIIKSPEYISSTTLLTPDNIDDATTQVYMLCNLAMAHRRLNDEFNCFKYVEIIRKQLGNIDDPSVSAGCSSAILECIGVEE